MDERYILQMRVQTLFQEMDRAKEVVKHIDPVLGKWVKSDINKEIDKQCLELKGLENSIIDEKVPVDKCWYDFQKCKNKSEPLFEECLAFFQGSLVRNSGLDDNVCKIADAILSDLENKLSLSWRRFSILGKEEIINKLTMIIRIRFPDASIWNLPLVGHEFGHFFGPKFEKETSYGHYHPIDDLIGQARRNGVISEALLHEYFADHFATSIFGPSYAFNCILLRFNPLSADIDQSSHPSDNKRAYWILEALKKMDAAEGDTQNYYSAIIQQLKVFWEKGRKTSNLPGSIEENLGEDTIELLNTLMKDFEEKLGDQLSTVRYKAKSWLRAQKLSSTLLQDAPVQLDASFSLFDVLNAAWWCRVNLVGEDPSRVKLIGKQATKICLKIGGISP